MKTTVDLPDGLVIAAKKRAAEERTTLRKILESGLRRELDASSRRVPAKRLRLVVSKGGLPPGLDLSSRVTMHEWLTRNE
jgi:hypothetical protein